MVACHRPGAMARGTSTRYATKIPWRPKTGDNPRRHPGGLWALKFVCSKQSALAASAITGNASGSQQRPDKRPVLRVQSCVAHGRSKCRRWLPQRAGQLVFTWCPSGATERATICEPSTLTPMRWTAPAILHSSGSTGTGIIQHTRARNAVSAALRPCSRPSPKIKTFGCRTLI